MNRSKWGLLADSGWFWWLTVSLALIAAALVLEFREPDQIVIPFLEISLPPTCWTRRWLGVNCPGCGLTRSFVMAAHGDLSGAAAVHPIGTVVFGFLVLQLPLRIAQGWFFLTNRDLEGSQTAKPDRPFVNWFTNGPAAISVLAGATALSFLWWLWNFL